MGGLRARIQTRVSAKFKLNNLSSRPSIRKAPPGISLCEMSRCRNVKENWLRSHTKRDG